MSNTRRFSQLLWAGITLCATVTVISLLCGTVTLSISDVWSTVTQDHATISGYVFLYSRLPRTLACLLAGAALSVSGAILQQVLANPLASSGIIGVNAGAGLGVTVACSLGLLSGAAISAAAFVGSMITVLLISLFAKRVSRTTVILGGVAINSLLSAFREALTTLQPDLTFLTTEFRIGGFSAVSYTRLLPAAVMIALGMLLLFTLFNELDVVSLGDETAHSVGLAAGRYRLLFLLLAALLAGAAVSFAGLLGFVGLIVPHGIRRLVGSESRRLVPLSAIFGAVLVCLCDLLSRLLFAPYELPVGILLALIGAPTFVLLLIRLKGGHHHA